MNCCPVKASVMSCGPFSNGFHARDSPATLDMAVIALFHTMRTDLVSVPPTGHMGYPAETSTEAESLISVGHHTDEPPFTLGKAETEGDRELKGLVLSIYVLSPPRVRIEEWGVPGGDEGGRVKGASDIQGIAISHQANQLVLTLTEVETTSAVEV